MRPRKVATSISSRGAGTPAYEGQRTAHIPDDLRGALNDDPIAEAAFTNLDARNRYALIWRLNDAKRPETRERHPTKFLDTLRRGETIH